MWKNPEGTLKDEDRQYFLPLKDDDYILGASWAIL